MLLVRLLIAFVIIVLAIIGIYAAPQFLLIENIKQFLSEYKFQIYPVFFCLQFLQGISLFLPLTPLTIGGSAILGPLPCFFLTWSALIASQMTNYGLSRALGRDFVKKKIGNSKIAIHDNRVSSLLHKYGYLSLYILYFSGIVSFDLMAYLLGLTKITPLRMLALAVIGVVPKIAILSFAADYIISGQWEFSVFVFSAILLGCVILSSVILLRKLIL